MAFKFLLAGAAALALAACGDGATEEAAPVGEDAMADETAASDAMADPAMPTDAQGFVDMAAASDMYEIEAGELAEEMGTSQAVKNFGAMMVADHNKASADLEAAAGEASGVTVNPQMTAKQQSDLEALRNAGENFDSVYKQQQVAAHEMALALMQGFAADGDAPALKEFAARTAPVIEGHLSEARTLP